jgi:hypothetical protein
MSPQICVVNTILITQVGGVPCGEMNLLEVEFLFMTNFTLFVTTETYRQVIRSLFIGIFAVRAVSPAQLARFLLRSLSCLVLHGAVQPRAQHAVRLQHAERWHLALLMHFLADCVLVFTRSADALHSDGQVRRADLSL